MDPYRLPTMVTRTPDGIIALTDRDGVVSLITLSALKDMLHCEVTRTQARRVERPPVAANGEHR